MNATSTAASTADRAPTSQPVRASRLGHLLETNPFPILLVAIFGCVLLVVLGPSLLIADSWLTLMAGREVAKNGLPATDEITVLGQGATWTNQQWLAQLLFYAAHALAGLRGVILLNVALVLLTLTLVLATARASGASARSTFLVGTLAAVAAPWGWTVRAQVVALPIFAAVLWLMIDAARNGVRRRTLLVVPLLVLWANLHGSVILGAALAVVLGILTLSSRGRRRGRAVSLALVVLAPLTVLASPYGTDLVAYYDLMLIDAPFADIVREWRWSEPGTATSLFWILAGLALALVVVSRCRRRLTLFELVVLGVTFVGAVQAIRGIPWFALSSAAILPVALDGLITRPDVSAPRLNRVISAVALAFLGAALLLAIVRPASWFSSEWPERQVTAVRAAANAPSVRLFASDRHANWLIWRIPALRGRIAFDVRSELYDRATLEDIVRYNGELGAGWKRLTDGYEVVVLDLRKPGPSHLEDFLEEPGTTVVYRDDKLVLLRREGAAPDA
jgi:hypothetical protein